MGVLVPDSQDTYPACVAKCPWLRGSDDLHFSSLNLIISVPAPWPSHHLSDLAVAQTPGAVLEDIPQLCAADVTGDGQRQKLPTLNSVAHTMPPVRPVAHRKAPVSTFQ